MKKPKRFYLAERWIVSIAWPPIMIWSLSRFRILEVDSHCRPLATKKWRKPRWMNSLCSVHHPWERCKKEWIFQRLRVWCWEENQLLPLHSPSWTHQNLSSQLPGGGGCQQILHADTKLARSFYRIYYTIQINISSGMRVLSSWKQSSNRMVQTGHNPTPLILPWISWWGLLVFLYQDEPANLGNCYIFVYMIPKLQIVISGHNMTRVKKKKKSLNNF